MRKDAGILFPISALPSRFGVGDLGTYAYQLVDRLYESHIHIWQILPLNPLGYGNSPYQPLSSQAGDEIYLDLEDMKNDGLLYDDEIKAFHQDDTSVHYQEVRSYKEKLYRVAFSRFKKNEDYQNFVKENEWLQAYAMFKVFKTYHQEKSWIGWEKTYKNYYDEQSFSILPFTQDIEFQIFLQYYFFKQWCALKQYANKRSIEIIGDMPIYVGLDSVDVWKNKACFLLEEDGTPSFIAGVPPDYFSKFGQRWGNPIYNWDYLKETNFNFWVERISSACEIYDTVRIDHFRAFDTYWKILGTEPTAINGEWIEAPGYEVFDTLFDKIPHLSILAEDLGELREEVYELRDHYHLKGMYVFQFHCHEKFDFEKVVVYTGTHDNDTLVGWLDSLNEEDKEQLDELLEDYKETEDYQKIIHYCLDLDASQVIVPVWDIMGCDTTCRFNVPGKIGSPNWEYRLVSFELLDLYLEKYKNMIIKSHREGK